MTKFFVLALVLATNFSYAKTANQEGSEFQVDKNVLNKIYSETTAEAKVDQIYLRSSVEIRPRFSILFPSVLKLSNKYFETDYSETVKGTPGFSLGIAAPVTTLGSFEIYAEGRVGYAMKEALVQVQSANGTNQDLLRLYWLPLSISLRGDYLIPSLRATLSLTAGAGAQWLYQTGRLDGIEQGFWVPFIQVGPSLTLFEGRGTGNWFGGLTLGTTYQSSVGSTQTIRSLSVDMSATILL